MLVHQTDRRVREAHREVCSQPLLSELAGSLGTRQPFCRHHRMWLTPSHAVETPQQRARPFNVFGLRPTKCSFYVRVCCFGLRPTRLPAHVSCWLFVFCSYCISIRVNIIMTIACSHGRVDMLKARMQWVSQPRLVPQTNELRAYSLAWQTSRHPAGSDIR